MGKWIDEGNLMDLELYKETLEFIIQFVSFRIGESPIKEIPPMVFVATPPKDPAQLMPELNMFAVESFTHETKYPMMRRMGGIAAENAMQVAAVFFVAESWLITRKMGDSQPTGDFSKLPDRKEIVAIAGMDLNHVMVSCFVHISRNEDGSMKIDDIERHYPDDSNMGTLHSDLLIEFVRGYAARLHFLVFGVPIDPTDTDKQFREREQKKTDA